MYRPTFKVIALISIYCSAKAQNISCQLEVRPFWDVAEAVTLSNPPINPVAIRH